MQGETATISRSRLHLHRVRPGPGRHGRWSAIAPGHGYPDGRTPRPREAARSSPGGGQALARTARLLASAHPPPRPPQDRARLPAPLRRDVRVGCGDVSGCDRAHGRRLRPHRLGSVGQRPADRRLPADHRDRLPLRAARRPALAQAADDRVRSRPRRASSACCRSPAAPRRSSRSPALAGIATGFFRPAVYAGLPNLVDDDDLPNANSLLQTVENLTWMVGPVVGGILIAAQGPDLAYWINACHLPALGRAARPDSRRADAGGHGREPRALARRRRRDQRSSSARPRS